MKNGVVLCKLMNKISPGSIRKIKESGPAFFLMENIQSFIKAAEKYGVPDEELFLTPDLFEERNIAQVSLCIYSLARTTQNHPEYKGPSLGPKMADRNERNFTKEQIRQGIMFHTKRLHILKSMAGSPTLWERLFKLLISI